MDKHAKAVTLNAQSNARTWHAKAVDAIEAGYLLYAKGAQANAAYWNELALSHLASE